MSNEELPSLEKQFKSATQMIADIVKEALEGNKLFATDFEKQRRLDICRVCEHFDGTSYRCRQCGCFMKKKVEFTAAQCPIKKW